MFQIPSLSDLSGRARSAFRANMPGSDAWLWPNNLYVTAKVIAGAVYEIFGFADYIARQKFAGTADGENLDLHGQEYGLARKPAAPASGNVTLTSTDDLAVAAGAVFERLDGVQYIAQAAVNRTGAGTLDVPVVAGSDGQTTNANSDTPLTIESGVTGDATAAVGSNGITLGTDVEADGDYWTTDLSTFRGRILFRKRNPPAGGSPADYVRWATDVSGVTRVFVERQWAGAGSVRVFVLMDDLYPDGIPSSGDIARVADYIDTVAPAGALVTVAAPTAVPVAITISGLTPNNTATQEAVNAELAATFSRLSRVAGSDTPNPAMPFLATPFAFQRGWIWQAVGNAAGVIGDAVTVPAVDTALSAGQIPTLGAVTFV